MYILVLRLGVPKEGGAAFTFINRRSINESLPSSQQVGIEMVGVVTVIITEVESGSIQKVRYNDLAVYPIEMAVARRSYQKIGSGIFRKICGKAIDSWAKIESIPDGWYAVQMVGVIAANQEEYIRGEVENCFESFPIMLQGTQIDFRGVSDPNFTA